MNALSNRSMRCFAVLAVGLGTSFVAHAQQTPLYVGIGFGQAKYDLDLAGQLRSGFNNSSFVPQSASFTDSKDSGYKLSVGYSFLPWLAFEADYVDLGKANTNYSFVTTSQLDRFTREGTYKVDGLNLAVVVSAPLTEGLSVYGKVGTIYAKYKYSESGQNFVAFQPSNTPPNHSFSAPELKRSEFSYGLGVDYALTKSLSLRVAWDRYTDLGNNFNTSETGNGKFDHIDLVNAGVLVRF